MTKVTIISGFLGAGKTTLIRKLLKEALTGEKCVLLENEYGEIGIDGGFMKESGIQVTELNSGCICCTLVGDFEKAIGEIIDTYKPDRLLIEPSGVGKLSDIRRVIEAQAAARGDMALSGCVTVADAGKCRMYMKNFGEFFIDQVKCAETLILSRTQLVSAQTLEHSAALLRAENAGARIITTPWDALDGALILSTIESPSELIDVNEICPPHARHHHHEDEKCEHNHHHHEDEKCECDHHHHEDDSCECDHHHHEDESCECDHHHHDDDSCECGCHHAHGEHDADEVFDNLGVETVRRFDLDSLKQMLEALEDERRFGMVIRLKGIVQATGGEWILFDYVPGEIDIRLSGADYTGRLCAIGVDLNKQAIRELFGV